MSETNPYRELSKQDPFIKTEMEELEDQVLKEEEEKVQRILKYLVKEYKTDCSEGEKYYLFDPGKHWWNRRQFVLYKVLDSNFGKLLKSRAKELGFSLEKSSETVDIGKIDYKNVLIWYKD